ncbi:hypothetical protein, partial [Sutterella massiliensis]|uniref:hypothetical protein n=1 Tax=Sutterella massiliensis TaxID=1816689 RepID=UPI0019600A6D
AGGPSVSIIIVDQNNNIITQTPSNRFLVNDGLNTVKLDFPIAIPRGTNYRMMLNFATGGVSSNPSGARFLFPFDAVYNNQT